MTVSELIEMLKNYPGDMRVIVNGYEGGYNDPSVKTEPVVFDYNDADKWYYGSHESARFVEGNDGVECVVLSRGR